MTDHTLGSTQLRETVHIQWPWIWIVELACPCPVPEYGGIRQKLVGRLSKCAMDINTNQTYELLPFATASFHWSKNKNKGFTRMLMRWNTGILYTKNHIKEPTYYMLHAYINRMTQGNNRTMPLCSHCAHKTERTLYFQYWRCRNLRCASETHSSLRSSWHLGSSVLAPSGQSGACKHGWYT